VTKKLIICYYILSLFDFMYNHRKLDNLTLAYVVFDVNQTNYMSLPAEFGIMRTLLLWKRES